MTRKEQMKYQHNKFNIIIILSTLIILFGAYYLLLNDTFLPTSISAIIAGSDQFDRKDHALVLGLIPIYISFMIFGASILGIYLGSQIQRLTVKIKNIFSKISIHF